MKKPKSTSDDSTTKLKQRSKIGPVATTRTCNGIEPCVDMETATQHFKRCCDTSGIPTSCSPLCKYNVTRNE
uniref:Uncharacterized protein n=1 Tax=Romanomermis culicivorax TaxID=13658 RepID=A0A915KB53_ROMCU